MNDQVPKPNIQVLLPLVMTHVNDPPLETMHQAIIQVCVVDYGLHQ